MTAWADAIPSRDALFEAKRLALLRAAASAFTRKGFHATSLDDIAQRLGVTKAALYRYFPSKHALLRECFARALEVGLQAIETARSEGGSGRERLRRALHLYLEGMIDELSCCVVLVEDNALLPRDHAALLGQRDRFEHGLRDLVRQGVEDGSIAPCDPKLAVFVILGAVNWVPKWFNREGEWSAAQISRALTDLLDRMVSSAPAVALPTDIGTMGV